MDAIFFSGQTKTAISSGQNNYDVRRTNYGSQILSGQNTATIIKFRPQTFFW